MWCCVTELVVPNVWNECAFFFLDCLTLLAKHNTFLWNTGNHSPNDTPHIPEDLNPQMYLYYWNFIFYFWKFFRKMASFINVNAIRHVMLHKKYKLLAYYIKYSSFPYRKYHNTNNTIHQTLTQVAKHCVIALFQVNSPSAPHFTNISALLRTSAT
jgi:hypothetical protein